MQCTQIFVFRRTNAALNFEDDNEIYMFQTISKIEWQGILLVPNSTCKFWTQAVK